MSTEVSSSRVSSESAICNIHIVIGSCMSRAAKCSAGREKGQHLVKLALALQSTIRRVRHWKMWTAVTCRYGKCFSMVCNRLSVAEIHANHILRR